MARHCIIVRQGDYQTYDSLYEAFTARLPVIWDRRQRLDAHADTTPDAGERRSSTPPASWVALGFVVVERSE
jgi:hypothetical protein